MYTVREIICTRGQTALYRGTRDADRAPVVLKVLGREHRPQHVERLKHEYEIGRMLDVSAVVRPLALDAYQGMPALVMEDFGGESLDRLLGREPVEIGRFLLLAIQIAEAVAEIHDKNVVHRDLKPENILVRGPKVDGTFEVKIADFGIASALSGARQGTGGVRLIEGSLPYLSPEQTGRMNRAIDPRSDLYSLGVTFYQILTGRLPFDATDPLEWVHCHIARSAVPPAVLVPSVPAALSAIVMKLLEKEAEDRYQSARGLRHDLVQCRDQWRSLGRIAPFPLGQRDVSNQFRIPQKLYGREQEIAALLGAFQRVVDTGIPELALIAGYAGIGKSSLVQELQKPIVRARGIFVAGKFEQYKRDIPYFTIVQAFTEIVLEILAESEERIASWKKRLQAALGVNAQLIIEVIPPLELVIGPQPAAPALPPVEAQNRFRIVFREFIGVLAQHEHPLALFVDDLQWADSDSLALLQVLATHPEIRNLLVVGAYRDNEVTDSHPLMLMVHEARKQGALISTTVLGPLANAHVVALLADTLHCRREDASPLADLVMQKTAGNPFFAIQFLTALRDERLIDFERSACAWRWDLARIRAKGFTDNVVDLMAAKAKRLSAASQKALAELACVGNGADTATLMLVLGRSEEDVHAALAEAVLAELIVRAGDRYKFVHDRIQEAAYSFLPEESRPAAHLRIGRLLVASLSKAAIEERCFEIANHLNRGASLITEPRERESLCWLSSVAGRKAKASIAYASARRYLAQATSLLPADAWSARYYDDTFGLYLDRSECEYLVGEFGNADALFGALLANARSNPDRARVYGLRMRLFQVSGRYDEGVTIALKALELFGVRLPVHDREIAAAIDAEIQEIRASLRGRRIADLLDAPVVTDPDVRAIIALLVDAEPCAYIGRPKIFPLLALKAVSLSLRCGNTEESCFAYSVYGLMLVSVFGDIPSAVAFSEMSLRLNDKLDDPRLRGTLLHLHGDHINFWRRHIATDLPILERAFCACLEVGDLVYAGFLAFETVWQVLEKGDPLDEVLKVSQKYAAFARQSHNDPVYETIRLEQQLVACLKGATRGPATFDDDAFDEASSLERVVRATFGCGIVFFHIAKQIAAFIYGDFAAALNSAAEAAATIGAAMAMPIEATHHFFHALTITALYPQAPAAKQEEFARTLETLLAKLKLWADNCPENFLNRYALASAEVARIHGRDLDAMRLYDQAIGSAGENGFVQKEAVANELAARFYRTRGFARIASAYQREARSCYARWGADGKVAQIDRLYPDLIDRRALAPSATYAVRAEQLDALSVVKAMQAISGEIVLDKLLGTLVRVLLEQAGAQKAYVILHRDDRLSIEAEAILDAKGAVVVKLLRSLPVAASPLLPTSIAGYVWRAKRMVLLDDAAETPKFAGDAYVARTRPKSILCLPILKQGEPIGLLYVENNSVTGAFVAASLQVLELLASQAAISLENALLLAKEAAARVAAQEAEHRAAFLADAGMLLGQSLDYENVLGQLASSTVHGLADWCVIDLVEQGEVRRVAAAHGDPSKQPLLDEIRRYPARIGSKAAGAKVLASHEPLVLADLTDAVLRALCVDDEHARIIRELGARSALAVPLIARGECIGAITLTSSRPQRYGRADLELAQELARRAAIAIDNARLHHETERAVRLRDEFLSVASHELRTPITSLQLMVQGITQGPVPPSPERVVKAFALAKRQIARLTRLVEELLEVTRIEAGGSALNLTSIDLSDVVRDVAQRFEAELERAGCTLSLRADSPVVGHWDRSKLEQVVTNLLSNASKFGAGKPIEIAAEESPRGTGRLVVKDHGIGIPPARLPYIFDRFERAVSAREYGGLGLGLYIVRSIVEALGGIVRVESVPAVGSTFTVELPCAGPPLGEASPKLRIGG